MEVTIKIVYFLIRKFFFYLISLQNPVRHTVMYSICLLDIIVSNTLLDHIKFRFVCDKY